MTGVSARPDLSIATHDGDITDNPTTSTCLARVPTWPIAFLIARNTPSASTSTLTPSCRVENSARTTSPRTFPFTNTAALTDDDPTSIPSTFMNAAYNAKCKNIHRRDAENAEEIQRDFAT